MVWFNPATWSAVDNIQNGLNGGSVIGGQNGKTVALPGHTSAPAPVNNGQVQGAETDIPNPYPNGNIVTWGRGAQGGPTPPPPSVDLSLYDANTRNLNDLLNRTKLGLTQGLQKNQDQYDQQFGNATNDKAKQVQGQNTAKQNAYDTIDRNAGQGFHSLAQIIGRASGTGSSAFRDLLPDVVGKDTSSKRLDSTNTYGQNLSNIDTSFDSVLQDLANQKKQNEDSLRSGVEDQRQGINQQLLQNAEDRRKAQGGTPAQALADAQPYQTAINNSRDSVEGFFNQFKPSYAVQSLNPNLAQYQTDRSQVNAQAQGAEDPQNPYASLLRKKLQGTA